MTAIGALILARAESLAQLADISAALSFEALRATDTAFHPTIHAARPHRGQQGVAKHMLKLIEGSAIRASHRENDPRVPKEEAEQVVDILKKEGRTVDVHYYAAEGHGFSKRENQIDAMKRMVAWFEQYLKGGSKPGAPTGLTVVR